MTLESKSDITNAAEPAREEELLASKMTHAPARKTHRKLNVVLVAVLAVVVAGAIGFGVYVGDYYHADDTALAAMEPTDTVAVRRLEDGDIAFVPGDPRVGIVFYPGGKVQAEAYAPLMQDLADRGFLCVIVCMPFNLAVLDANGADGVQERFPAVRRWILMGHSLGGVMAAGYLDGRAQSWDGLVLLGAYSTADLSDDGVTVLSSRGIRTGCWTAGPPPTMRETSARVRASSSSPAATTPSSARTARRTVTARRASRPRSNGSSPPTRWLACSCEAASRCGWLLSGDAE